MAVAFLIGTFCLLASCPAADHRRHQRRNRVVVPPAVPLGLRQRQSGTVLPADGRRLPHRDVLSAGVLPGIAQHRWNHLQDDLRAGLPHDCLPAVPDRVDNTAGRRH
uniref:(northern house mosquito) hypothetical protein n=1 Tax=Culex pipiens TaxID=7175 RepID=A0A8D8KRI0_CULPI